MLSMQDAKFYDNQASAFMAYIRNTDQKKVLVSRLLDHLKSDSLGELEKLRFTDIGAGDGTVTLAFVREAMKTVPVEASALEPSEKLVQAIKEKDEGGVLNVMHSTVEDVELPDADLVLAAHVFRYIENEGEVLDGILQSLSPKGRLLIVETNKESGDVLMRGKLGVQRVGTGDVTSKILDWCRENDVSYEHEIVPSRIEMEPCMKLEDDGKAIISFFYHKPFSSLTEDEVRQFQEAASVLMKDGALEKKEDYIWVAKR